MRCRETLWDIVKCSEVLRNVPIRTDVYRCAPRCAEGGDSWMSGRETSNARGLVRKVGLAGRL